MHPHKHSKPMIALSAISLLLSMALAAFLGERVLAAAWQWFKFAGYSNDGHISLSYSTGLAYSAALAAIFIVSLALSHVARAGSIHRAKRISGFSAVIAALSGVTYWLLALSPLNSWRA